MAMHDAAAVAAFAEPSHTSGNAELPQSLSSYVHSQDARHSVEGGLADCQRLLREAAVRQQMALEALHHLQEDSLRKWLDQRWPPEGEQVDTSISVNSTEAPGIRSESGKGETMQAPVRYKSAKSGRSDASKELGADWNASPDQEELSSPANSAAPSHTHSAVLSDRLKNSAELSQSWTAQLKDMEGLPAAQWLRAVLLSHRFELFCTSIMIINVITLLVRLEMHGLRAGQKLGEIGNTGITDKMLDAMEHLEIGFTVWFTFELFLRWWSLGCHAFADALSAFDAFIVFATLLDMTITYVFQVDGMNISIARMIRILKVLKFFRTFKAASAFTELRILLRTVLRSAMALVWTVVVLSMIIVGCASFAAQLLESVVLDNAQDYDLRAWVFEHYGTATRASYTMLEATLSGGWPNYARRLVIEVSPMWAIFWTLYVFAVIFAVIRVMGALFLAASLKAASQDDDMQAIQRIKDAKVWSNKLRHIFGVQLPHQHMHGFIASKHKPGGDHHPEDVLHKSRFEKTLHDFEALKKLSACGFEPVELRTLFALLSAGSTSVDMQAFCLGAVRLKGGVKAFDIVEILQEIKCLKESIREDRWREQRADSHIFQEAAA